MKNKNIFLIMTIIVMIFECYNSEISVTTNKVGDIDGYTYEFWKEEGTGYMNLLGGGSCFCRWFFEKDAIFRIGKRLDSPKLWNEFGNFTVKYNADYSPTCNSYLSIYGRNKKLYNDFYIVENWGASSPSGEYHIGSIWLDGDYYDMYMTPRIKALIPPVPGGYCYYEQLWSVRRNKRTEGTDNVRKHMEEWSKQGLNFGIIDEVFLSIEVHDKNVGHSYIYETNITVG